MSEIMLAAEIQLLVERYGEQKVKEALYRAIEKKEDGGGMQWQH